MKIKIKGHLLGYHFAHMADDEPLYWSFATSHTGTLSESLLIAIPHEIEAEVPDEFSVLAAKVAGIESAMKTAAEDYQKTVADLRARLSKLQAIECSA